MFYKVSLITDISKLTLKELLSHPRTKNSLTIIFALKAIELLNQEKKIYMVGYQRQIDSNIPFWSQISHLHEEAGTSVLLGLHVFSGCDQVGKTITKARVMKLFKLPLTTHAVLESF